MPSLLMRSWVRLLDETLAAKAIGLAKETALRLREFPQVEAAVALAKRQSAYPQFVRWQPYGVAQGYAGLAVLFSYLDACFPGEGWDRTAHRHLELAARGTEESTPASLGLFAGLSGLAFATWCLSRQGTRYRRLLATVEDVLLPQTVALAEDLGRQKHGVSVGEFDLISGLSGVGAYLLCRRGEPKARNALQALLSSFVDLTKAEAGLPRWYTPAHRIRDETMLKYFPHGNLNCGLAHGIPGPLALLALGKIAEVEVNGLEEAIDRVAAWLCRYRFDDAWGVNWPTAVPLREAASPKTPPRVSEPSVSPFGPSRNAWCYGSPGVARSLWLAGEALDAPEYRALAVAAMEAVYQRPLAQRMIDSPTFCHGVAGLLQITLRFAHDTRLPVFEEAAQALTTQLLALHEPDSLLGYRSIEKEGRRVDQPGLLDGAPGVALVLFAAATEEEPTCDRLFLLS